MSDVNSGTVVVVVNGTLLSCQAEIRAPPMGLSIGYNPSFVYPMDPVIFQLKQQQVMCIA